MIPALEELLKQGYVFGSAGNCRGCGARILWFRTPQQKPAPFNPITYESHWATCPNASQFRTTKPRRSVRCLRIIDRPGQAPLIIADGEVLKVADDKQRSLEFVEEDQQKGRTD